MINSFELFETLSSEIEVPFLVFGISWVAETDTIENATQIINTA